MHDGLAVNILKYYGCENLDDLEHISEYQWSKRYGITGHILYLVADYIQDYNFNVLMGKIDSEKMYHLNTKEERSIYRYLLEKYPKLNQILRQNHKDQDEELYDYLFDECCESFDYGKFIYDMIADYVTNSKLCDFKRMGYFEFLTMYGGDGNSRSFLEGYVKWCEEHSFKVIRSDCLDVRRTLFEPLELLEKVGYSIFSFFDYLEYASNIVNDFDETEGNEHYVYLYGGGEKLYDGKDIDLENIYDEILEYLRKLIDKGIFVKDEVIKCLDKVQSMSESNFGIYIPLRNFAITYRDIVGELFDFEDFRNRLVG